MEKIESFETVNDTMSNRLFECYRIALDFGLDVGELAAKDLFEEDNKNRDITYSKD